MGLIFHAHFTASVSTKRLSPTSPCWYSGHGCAVGHLSSSASFMISPYTTSSSTVATQSLSLVYLSHNPPQLTDIILTHQLASLHHIILISLSNFTSLHQNQPFSHLSIPFQLRLPSFLQTHNRQSYLRPKSTSGNTQPLRFHPLPSRINFIDESTGATKMTRLSRHELCNTAWRRYMSLIDREQDVFVAESTICGRGLFVVDGILPNQVVAEYTGVRLTNAQAAQAYNNSYHFRVDRETIIDGKDVGVACFANHSCNPNSQYRIVQLGGEKRKVAVFIYSRVRICAGSEITVDYNWTTNPFIRKEPLLECQCSQPVCRHLI